MQCKSIGSFLLCLSFHLTTFIETIERRRENKTQKFQGLKKKKIYKLRYILMIVFVIKISNFKCTLYAINFISNNKNWSNVLTMILHRSSYGTVKLKQTSIVCFVIISTKSFSLNCAYGELAQSVVYQVSFFLFCFRLFIFFLFLLFPLLLVYISFISMKAYSMP